MKRNYVTISFLFLVLVIVLSIIWNVRKPKIVTKSSATASSDTHQESNITKFCYYDSTKNTSGFDVTTWLRMNITDGESVQGEYHQYLNGGKNSYVGTFSGTLEGNITIIKQSSNTQQGVEFFPLMTDTDISVAFGDKVTNKSNGIRKYSTPSKVTFGDPIPKVNCDSIDEMDITESYIKNNIKKIEHLDEKDVVTDIDINPITHTADIYYNDAYGNYYARSEYQYNTENKHILITSFTEMED